MFQSVFFTICLPSGLYFWLSFWLSAWVSLSLSLSLFLIAIHLSLKDVPRVEVVLYPGDVLFVPHRWWHHVENLDLAVSVNTWIEIPEDVEARCKEAIVKTLCHAIMPTAEEEKEKDDDDDEDNDDDKDDDVNEKEKVNGREANVGETAPETRPDPPWLNPTESASSTAKNVRCLNKAIEEFFQEGSNVSNPAPKLALGDTIVACRCHQFRIAECECSSRLRGKVLRPCVVKKEGGAVSPIPRDKPREKITRRKLIDVLTNDDVLQLIFEKLKSP